MDVRGTYLAAADAFAELLERLPTGPWDSPGLGEWSLRDLLGHAVSSGFVEVRAVLSTPAQAELTASAQAYFGLARTVPAEVYAAAVAASTDSARRDGAALGDAPAATARALIGEITALLDTLGDDDLVTTAGGGMRVAAWLPTRTFELVVHGGDVAAAAGIEFTPPPAAVASAVTLAARIAAEVGDGVPVLRALTGRATLPEAFSVV